ncbi:hypothetical protein HIDPHFAB_03910 [Nocardioides sp. T2.26MG-1]|nr:hypothetical protein HIDPHFAB_03910 [Nocardioides sp. T2.26MG-1]
MSAYIGAKRRGTRHVSKSNVSADIRELCCWALDLVDVPWRQSNHKTISVSTRAAVARLDTLIGMKQ